MNPKYLEETFVQNNVPAWACPTCRNGTLELVGDFSMKDDAVTMQSSGEEWFDPEYSHYVFTGLLRCKNCHENVVVCGDGGIVADYGFEGVGYYNVLTPKFFIPSLRIIEPNVSEKVPADAVMFLEKAFQVFWCDADSCVNRLRTVLEYILDDLGVERSTANDPRLNLANRINKLTDPKYYQVKQVMTSIRHMGNDGSHGSIGIERAELISAFAVVKYCLEQLYPNVGDHGAVLDFVKKVNKQKGFRQK